MERVNGFVLERDRPGSMLADRYRRVREYLVRHGSRCLSYSTLQPGLVRLVDEEAGYLACWPRGTWPVLSNPVADPVRQADLLVRLRERQRAVCVAQADALLARELVRRGFRANQIGVEVELEIQGFSLAGKYRQKLRQWRNKCRREGVEIREAPVGTVPPAQLEALMRAWRARKPGRPGRFLMRPFDPREREPDVRYFWAWQDGRLVGLGGFDPIYRDGKVIGYYHNFDRVDPAAPHGVSVSIALFALERFRDEGKEILSLGIAPAVELDHELPGRSALVRGTLRFLFRRGNRLYPFRGNYQHKRKFAGRHRPVYLVAAGSPALAIWSVLRACNLV